MTVSQPTRAASMWSIVHGSEQHGPVLERLNVELGRVESRFHQQLDIEIPAVERLCGYIERYRGKMLRPSMTILSGLAGAANVVGHEGAGVATPGRNSGESVASGGRAGVVDSLGSCIGETHIVLAAVCEMVHMATLVHDDVLDEAEMRRKGATVNYLHGNEAAVLLGDYLISNAFHLCSTLSRPELNERIGRVTNSMCAGELLQLHHRNDWSIDPATYFEIIDRKTASLIGLCCEFGAGEAGAGREVSEAMGRFGRRLGLAFQIQDDLLDLMGEERIVGKSLGKDLEKHKLTLPVILHFRNVPAGEREEMLDLLACQDERASAAEIRKRLEASGAVGEARATAESMVGDARRELGCLTPSPASELLDAMADAVIARRF